MDGQGQADGQADGQANGQTTGQTNGQTTSQTNGQTQTHGQADEAQHQRPPPARAAANSSRSTCTRIPPATMVL